MGRLVESEQDFEADDERVPELLRFNGYLGWTKVGGADDGGLLKWMSLVEPILAYFSSINNDDSSIVC